MMAYSDYGGYAYRNGIRIDSRSDWTIQPDGTGVGTPGAYPGFAVIAAGMDAQQVRAFSALPHYHAALGDGPIFIGLYKQSIISVHREFDDVPIVEHVEAPHYREYKGSRYIDDDWYRDHDEPCVIRIDGCVITVRWELTDNFYIFARMEQPDGVVWHGWSGYGVGAGLEEADYGFSTSDVETWLTDLWPDAIRDTPPDDDPTPWCHVCGSMTKQACHCGPIAENE